MLASLEPEPANCDAQCKQDRAAQALQTARAGVVTVKQITVAGVEIVIPLNLLSGDNLGPAIANIMASVADMPLEVQQAVFASVLREKAKYQDQQRLIEKLTAESLGLPPPEPVPPAFAVERVEPTGSFGLFFNAEVAGLAFLQALDRGLSSRGVVAEGIVGRRLKSEEFSESGPKRRLSGENDFRLDSFLAFSIQRGAEDAAKPEDLGFTVKSAGLENSLLLFHLEFDDPLKVSTGSQKDLLIATIIDG